MARSARCGSTNTARPFSTFIFAKWRAWTESSPTLLSRPIRRSASSGPSIQNNSSNNPCSRATTRRASFSNSGEVRYWPQVTIGSIAELDKKIICYSGDTEWIDVLLKAAHGADLFICECYMFDKVVRAHL